MKLNLLTDSDWESRISKTVGDLISTPGLELLETNQYGSGLNSITVLFVCHDPQLSLKKRVSFDMKSKDIYLDIVLNLSEMKCATPDQRRRRISEQLVKEVPETLATYKPAEFNSAQFIRDLRTWLLAE